MQELMDKAVEKITEEMMKDNRPAIRVIEEHLTGLCVTEAVAEKLLAGGKTLAGAYKAIEAEARKQAGGRGGACVDDLTGFRIVEEYYGITEEDKSGRPKAGNVIDILDLL